MTVCIGALSDGGKGAVVVSDRMTTSNVAGMQYQWQAEDVQKIFPFPQTAGAVLMAGNDSYGRTIIADAIGKIKNDNGIEKIVSIFQESYKDFRLNDFTKNFLEPKGFKSLQDYYAQHTKIGDALRTEIDSWLSKWSGMTDLIIVGKDRTGTFRIYSIATPTGAVNNHDSSGYISVGTGGPHAMYYMIGSGYTRSAKSEDVKKIVLEAKKKAEAAPGVGSLTAVEVFQ